MRVSLLYLFSIISRRLCACVKRLNEYGRLQKIHRLCMIHPSVKISRNALISNGQGNPERLEIGEGTNVDGIITVFPFGKGIKIGKYTYIGQGSRVWAADRILIGDNVLISHNCNVIDTDSHEIDHLERLTSGQKQLKTGRLPSEKGNVETAPITIKDNAWLSYNVSILKGVTIGRGAIIGAGAVVTHDIPDFCLAAGNPARVIKRYGDEG